MTLTKQERRRESTQYEDELIARLHGRMYDSHYLMQHLIKIDVKLMNLKFFAEQRSEYTEELKSAVETLERYIERKWKYLSEMTKERSQA